MFRTHAFSRREALQRMAAGLVAASVAPAFSAEANRNRKMTINLMGGMIGVRANQREAIELAHAHGFESVEAMGGELARLSDAENKELLANMRSKGVVFGAAGLPVDFRGEEAKFEEGLKELPRIADALQRAEVTRMG